jgi:hypothetical protein
MDFKRPVNGQLVPCSETEFSEWVAALIADRDHERHEKETVADAFQAFARWAHKLTTAIRAHRDRRGDDRCWQNDITLWQVLPEGYVPPERDVRVEIENCKADIKSCHIPGVTYVSPQVEIDRLTAEVKALRERLDNPCSACRSAGFHECNGPHPDQPERPCLKCDLPANQHGDFGFRDHEYAPYRPDEICQQCGVVRPCFVHD